MVSKDKKYTLQEARVKAEEYCVYRDRCHSEVKDKLYSWGLPTDHVDAIMYDLIQKNFLNEERFAKSFVSGKFKIKKWGKRKIALYLKQKNISDFLINTALSEIDEENYLEVLNELVQKKCTQTNGKNDWEVRQKVKNYLYNRGFEPELINDALNDFLESEW